MLSFSRFEAIDAASSLLGKVCSDEAASGVELCTDCLGDAFLDEAKQFGFYIVAGELEREPPRALTVPRLREDLVDGVIIWPQGSPPCWRADRFLRRSIGREQTLLPHLR
jgi:hypothetical protein